MGSYFHHRGLKGSVHSHCHRASYRMGYFCLCHAIRFHNLAGESQWIDEALANTFFLTLSDGIKDRLIQVDVPTCFIAPVELSINVDHRLQELEWLCYLKEGLPALETEWHSIYWSPFPGQDPCLYSHRSSSIQFDQIHLNQGERRDLGLCLYCGGMSVKKLKNLFSQSLLSWVIHGCVSKPYKWTGSRGNRVKSGMAVTVPTSAKRVLISLRFQTCPGFLRFT